MTRQTAFLTVETLFWASFVLSLTCVCLLDPARSLLRRHWRIIGSCLILTVLWRLPSNERFFHGMEYEDSYIYTVAGRQIASHAQLSLPAAALPFSVPICTLGSLTHCKLAGEFPEHLIGYPYILSVAIKPFGYRPSIGSLVNLIASCFADALIFMIGILIAGDTLAATAAASIFAITPVFAVWGLETSAEPISNACITVVLFLFLCMISLDPPTKFWRRLVTASAFSATLLFSLLIKRENILLALLLFVTTLVVNQAKKPSSIAYWAGGTFAVALILAAKMRLLDSTIQEQSLLHSSHVTILMLAKLLPIFLGSFFVIQWYGGTVLTLLIGAVACWRRKGLFLIPLSILLAYVLTYAFHVRGYYEMQAGSTDSRSALRFSMNLMSLWALLSGVGVATLLRWLNRRVVARGVGSGRNWALAVVLIITLGASYTTTEYIKEDAVEDEFRMRIEPNLAGLRAIADGDIERGALLTWEPLVAQMYATPDANVISIADLDDEAMREIRLLARGSSIIYVDETIHSNATDAARYQDQLGYLTRLHCEDLTSGREFVVKRCVIAP